MAIRFVNRLEDANIITHGGKVFHGDDIFGICFLNLLLGDVRCYRVPYNQFVDVNTIGDKIMFDTGGGPFDHHQMGGNGVHKLIDSTKEAIPNASFGLLWEAYGLSFLKDYYPYEEDRFYTYIYKYVDFHLVRAIDSSDNGKFPFGVEGHDEYRVLSLSCIISFLNKDEIVKEKDNDGLWLALNLARKAFLIVLNRGKKAYYMGESYKTKAKVDKSSDFSRVICEALKEEISKVIEREAKDDTQELSTIKSVWEFYSDEFCSKYSAEDSEYLKDHIYCVVNGFCAEEFGWGYKFREEIDEMDCYTISDVFSSPIEYGGNSFEEDLKAIFREVFKNTVKAAVFKINSKKYVEREVMKTKDHILVLKERAYWQDWIANMPEAKKIWFVVCPTENKTWKVKPVPCKYTANGYRRGFPSKWFGYSKDGTNNINKKFDDDVIFIHSSGFLAICKTFESALHLATIAQGNQENNIKEAVSN